MKRISVVAGVALALSVVPVLAQMQYSTPIPQKQIEAPKSQAPGSAAPKIEPVIVDTPKPKCEDPPSYPGRVGMQTEDRRNRFVGAVDAYKNCMLAFVEERKAVIKANETAARGAIESFNVRMKQLNEEQEKARE